ncbi:CDP-alcohol phosphatidyltransferase family protein [Chlamydiales bacterium]|nr:CDP-alcohol phosphatidyltransferase family protein [Chlamydiales bacterium]
MRRKVPFLPNLITAFGLSCGLFAIFRASLVPQGAVDEKILTFLTGILLLAALADILDGAVARILKAESEFGGFFDSIADAISFGVAPAVIVIKSLPISPDGKFPFVIMAAAMVYSLCGVLRLIRFSVQHVDSESNPALALAHKKHFTGLPIPAAAAAAIGINLFLVSDDVQSSFGFSPQFRLWTLFVALIILGYFMISRWKFPSIKTLRMPIGSFQLVFFTVLIAIFIFYGVINHFPLVLFTTSWGYIAVAWTLSIIRRIAGKKSKTLEEFEPDDSDFLD